MLSAKRVAEYFLFRAYQDEELLTNLKLQKLLYYSQGFHLAVFDKPLFKETIQCWTHGPVVPALYHEYKEHGSNPLPLIDAIDLKKYEKDVIELLDEVYNVFGQYTAFTLRNMTHQEPPWKETPSGADIDLDLMKTYFKTRIEKNG